jgi:hypothetical protein
MDHRGVTYTIRVGIVRDHWVVVVHLPNERTVEKQIRAPRCQAEALACSIIDEWLEGKSRKQ